MPSDSQHDSAAERPTLANLSGKTALIVGASRGLGHATALAFAQAGAQVVAVSRSAASFPDEARAGAIRSERADAGEAGVPALLLDRHEPDIVVLVAGAMPHMRALQQQTWETFSANWEVDVRIAFHWLREALLKPLKPGAKVVVVSSGAALAGSPLSGGYAGAKAMQRMMAGYAQEEARRAGLDITFSAVLPRFAPQTGVGQSAVRAYAARAGMAVADYLASFQASSGPLLSPEGAGAALVNLVAAPAAEIAPYYVLTGAGLQKLPG
jgi:NAD(P)-dependent dehydrogenase (short-subunit alcohol dehydrogenase family)